MEKIMRRVSWQTMRMKATLFCLFLIAACGTGGSGAPSSVNRVHHSAKEPVTRQFPENSWQYFLQHLPVVDSPVRDYRGKQVRDQYKNAGVVPYDVGTKDLQQCADALMRLRAEFLFDQKRYDEIGFHFVSGQYYSFNDYCAGKRPVASGNQVRFVQGEAARKNHASLRRYLDLVYAYASTISLAREMKPADSLEVGTVVIYPGSPGHCFIVIDEGVDEKGERVFRLAESYTPAQSIYVLRNPGAEEKTPWQPLPGSGTIHTASYVFENYKLRKFE